MEQFLRLFRDGNATSSRNASSELLGLLHAMSIDDGIKKLKAVPYIPFPVCFRTVDGIITNGSKILLVRKPNQPLNRFPGGFVDPGETTMEAVKREMKEEINLTFGDPDFLFEMPIDDPRYRESPHKIVTSVYWFNLTKWLNSFHLNYLAEMKAQDDIAHLEWFDIETDFRKLKREPEPGTHVFNIEPYHQEIFSRFLSYYDESKH